MGAEDKRVEAEQVQANETEGNVRTDEEASPADAVIDLTEPSAPTTRRFYANLADL